MSRPWLNGGACDCRQCRLDLAQLLAMLCGPFARTVS